MSENIKQDIKQDVKQDLKDEFLDYVKQIKNGAILVNILKELSSDPLRRAVEDKVQQLIIDNIESSCTPKDDVDTYKDTDVPIYEKLSVGDVYIVRIVEKGLEFIQNDGEDVKYKRIELSIDKPS